MKINEKIKYYRTKNKISQDELAKKTFTTKSTISKWESGSIIPNVNMIKIIAKALNVSFYSIVGEKEPLYKKMMGWLGKLFTYLFFWIHVDITIGGTLAIIGGSLIVSSLIGGVGYSIVIIVNNSISGSWGTIETFWLVVSILEWPLMLAVLGSFGCVLIYISKYIYLFSLKYFWNIHSDFLETKFIKIKQPTKKQIVFSLVVISISILVTIIFYSVIGATSNMSQIQIKF